MSGPVDQAASKPARARRIEAPEDRNQVPWPLAVPATIAVAFLLVPLLGLLVRAPWRSLDQRARGEPGRRRAAPVADLRQFGHRPVAAVRRATRLGAGPGAVSRKGAATRPGHPAARTPTCCGRCRVAARVRPSRHRRAVPGLLVRLHPAVHHLGVVVAETFVAMPFLIVTVEGAFRSADRGYEEAAATLGASRADGVPPRHAAADRPVAGGRLGAVLGPRARRVRRHDHLRRQLPGPHADDAHRGLPRARA